MPIVRQAVGGASTDDDVVKSCAHPVTSLINLGRGRQKSMLHLTCINIDVFFWSSEWTFRT